MIIHFISTQFCKIVKYICSAIAVPNKISKVKGFTDFFKPTGDVGKAEYEYVIYVLVNRGVLTIDVHVFIYRV